MKGLRLDNATKNFGKTKIINQINLDIHSGEFCVFVGPSGCGKSTLLRMIAGLEDVSAGSIFIRDKNVTNLDPAQRGVSMVFQSYALYPHMNVADNMGFGLKMNGVPKAEVAQKVQAAANILKLTDYLDKLPKQLSGGQRQRVAIGRAIVRQPDVFLFDEPLSNLDAELRVEMRVEISRLHKTLNTTMIYVTHDQVEAMTMADKIVVLRSGNIEQVGMPLDVYEDPDNIFVASFIGSPAMNFLDAKSIHADIAKADIPDVVANTNDDNINFGFRPEDLKINHSGQYCLIDFIEHLGGNNLVYLSTNTGNRLIVEEKNTRSLKIGHKVGLNFNKNKVYLFDKKTGLRIRK